MLSMGLLDNINKAFRGSPDTPILTKKPGFSITQFTTNNPFTNLIQPESNYFDQYILYTAKCIDYISSKVASSDIDLFDESDNEIEKNDMYQDLKAFNPHMNLWEARKLKEMHLMLTGAAYWYIDREPTKGKNVEFYPLDPTKIQIKTDESGLPAMYSYTDANGKIVSLDINDVVYFRRMNPANWFEGLSQVKSAAFWTNAYAQGAQYNMNKLGNNINVDKFLVFEGISDNEKIKVETQLRNKYGGARNAGRTAVVPIEPKVVDMSSNQKDLDYVQGMKLLREDILAYFGIPEAIFFPSATNSNTSQAITMFQRDTLEPLLLQEMAVLNEQVIPKYSITRPVMGVHFDFEGVVDEDKVAEANAFKINTEGATIAYNDGVITTNQYLELMGFEPIKGGDVYKEVITPPDTQAISDNAKSLKDELDKMLEMKDHQEMVIKSNQLADEQEGIVYQASEALFQDQFKRTIDYVNKIDEVNVRGVFNFTNEVKITKEQFAQVYAKVIANSNDVGNIEIKSKLLKKNNPGFAGYKAKSISGEAMNEIAKKLDYFANEINTTTRDKLRKIIADGIENGFDKDLFRTSIESLFNEFIDGQGNIDVLGKYYVPSIEVNASNEAVTNGGSRYKTMLGKITSDWANGDITKTQRNEALSALRGLIDPSDPIGKDVDSLLNGWEVPKTAGITKSRAVTIARTEATFARNLGFNDVYENNPFVTGKKWNSLHDRDVRDSHARLDGTVVKIGEAFQADSGKMMFPGDTSLGVGAEDIINCRCRQTAVVI